MGKKTKKKFYRFTQQFVRMDLSNCRNIDNGPTMEDMALLLSASGYNAFGADKPLSKPSAEVYFLVEGDRLLKVHRIMGIGWDFDKLIVSGTYEIYDDADNFVAEYDPQIRKGVFYFT